MFLAQCLLEPLRTQDPVTGLEGSWAERRGTLSQGNLTWPGSSPGSTLGSCSLCSVASVSSSLLRMMVWVGGRAGGRAVGAAAFLPSGLWSRWMWNLRCPLRLKLKGEDAGSGAPPRLHRPGSPRRLHPASPLPAELALKGLLVGVGQHVPPQVLLVLGGEAALAALVGPQARVLCHVGLRAGRGQRCSGQTAPDAPGLCSWSGATCWLHHEATQPSPCSPLGHPCETHRLKERPLKVTPSPDTLGSGPPPLTELCEDSACSQI